MKLVGLKLKNFRIYKEEIFVHFSDLACIIGKNDIGKSTIIEALDIFFNDGVERGDLCVTAGSDTIEISCLFDEYNDKVILDSTVETSLLEESLLNKENLLEIKKTFKVGSAISKAVYLLAYHENHEKLITILTLKNTALKALATELGINLTGINKTKNNLLRNVIKQHIKSDKILLELKVDGNVDSESNLKAVWSKLKDYLPIFTLFKVDKTIDDKDKDVQDPMKQAIKETLAIPEIRELLGEIERQIKIKSTQVAELTLEKLKEIDPSLAEKMKSDFSKLPTWDKIFDLTLLNENNVPLNKRGSGVKRLVLLSFFQAQAEKKKVEYSSPSIIYAIEEPETAQHPNHQKILINSLLKLSERDNIQVIFTTHSSNLVREIPMESLIYIHKNTDGESLIEYGMDFQSQQINEQTIEKIIDTLGVLPNPSDKIAKILFVEGNHDVNALKRYSKILNLHDANIIPLDIRKDIAIVIAGGSCLKFYIDHKYLDGLGKPEVHIYDNDIEDYQQYVAKINEHQNKRGFNTIKSELENYLSKEAIEESYAMNGTIIIVPEITDDMDVPLIIAQILQDSSSGRKWEELTQDEQSKKVSKCKKHLNTIAIEKMTLERMNERNSIDELSEWFLSLN